MPASLHWAWVASFSQPASQALVFSVPCANTCANTASVGDAVGVAVGAGDGVRVGAAVGASVGAGVGFALGDGVGAGACLQMGAALAFAAPVPWVLKYAVLNPAVAPP
jgi:hypothetical protein